MTQHEHIYIQVSKPQHPVLAANQNNEKVNTRLRPKHRIEASREILTNYIIHSVKRREDPLGELGSDT